MMEVKQDEIYQEYKLARYSIQLSSAGVTRCNAEQGPGFGVASNYSIGLQLHRKHRWVNETAAEGYLLTDIILAPKENQDSFILKMQIEIKGIFQIANKPEDESVINKFLSMQLVPQLLPYARGAARTIASMMGVTVPCELIPTMDVLKSIRGNRDHD